MGRKKAGGGTPADLGQLKLEVVLNATQAEQFKNLCTILMQSPGQLAKEMVLDAMWKETLQILKSVALSYSADLPNLQGDACGPICRPSGPQAPQAREKCEGTCSGKCTLAQQVSFALAPDASLADYVFCTEKGLRGGEADEESLQKKQGTPTADHIRPAEAGADQHLHPNVRAD